MQLLPSLIDESNYSTESSYNNSLYAGATNSSTSSNGFDSIYSSFIEEGRSDYSGLPTGFSANVVQNGTISRETIEELQKSLEEKDAQQASIDALNQLMSSGSPLTMGKVMGLLTGNSRATTELTDDERKTFRSLMTRMGASTDEIDDMLAASDKGNGQAIWNKFAKLASGLSGDSQSFSKEETSALLRSLDLSKDNQKFILQQFKDEAEITLSKEQMNSLFGAARTELSDKALAQQKISSILNGAMKDALNNADLNKKSDPVEDIRGNKRSSQLEAIMQDTNRKKHGLGDLYSLDEENEEKITGRQFALNTHVDEKSSDTKAEKLLPQNDTKGDTSSSKKDTSFGTLSAKVKTSASSSENTAANNIFTAMPSSQMFEGNNAVLAQKESNAGSAYNSQIFDQVKSGLLQSGQNGGSQITLQLDPKDLGQLSLMLNVREGEVRAIIRAENPESAAAISDQLAQLKSSLEEQGLKVADIEVRTGLENNSADNWNGSKEHNAMYESQEKDRLQRLNQLRREATQEISRQNTAADNRRTPESGIYIVA